MRSNGIPPDSRRARPVSSASLFGEGLPLPRRSLPVALPSVTPFVARPVRRVLHLPQEVVPVADLVQHGPQLLNASSLARVEVKIGPSAGSGDTRTQGLQPLQFRCISGTKCFDRNALSWSRERRPR